MRAMGRLHGLQKHTNGLTSDCDKGLWAWCGPSVCSALATPDSTAGTPGALWASRRPRPRCWHSQGAEAGFK
jgi:hypothetical protein